MTFPENKHISDHDAKSYAINPASLENEKFQILIKEACPTSRELHPFCKDYLNRKKNRLSYKHVQFSDTLVALLVHDHLSLPCRKI